MPVRDVSGVLEELKAAKFRITAARKAVVEVVLSAGAPVSAQDVSAGLKKLGVAANVTTVYRELEFLRERGVLVPVTFVDGVQRYEPSDLGHHHHLVCVECNGIQDVVVAHDQVHAVEKDIEKRYKFTVVQHALEFYGRCAKCS